MQGSSDIAGKSTIPTNKGVCPVSQHKSLKVDFIGWDLQRNAKLLCVELNSFPIKKRKTFSRIKIIDKYDHPIDHCECCDSAKHCYNYVYGEGSEWSMQLLKSTMVQYNGKEKSISAEVHVKIRLTVVLHRKQNTKSPGNVRTFKVLKTLLLKIYRYRREQVPRRRRQ